MKKLQKVLSWALCIVMTMSFAACGSSNYQKSSDSSAPAATFAESASYGDYGYYSEALVEEEAYDEGSYDNGTTSGTKADPVKDTSRKLITTYNINAETEEFDGFMEAIKNKVNELNGYIENLDTSNGSIYSDYYSNRYSSLTVRIPAANADAFMLMVGEKGNITYQSMSVDDVTLQYVDMESRKNSYLTEQDRVLELIEQAETIEELLILEDKLSEIRYQIESLESQLRTYDNKIDYTTFYLSVSEVQVYTEPEIIPETYGQKIANSFTKSVKNVFEGLKNFLVGLVGAVPGLVVFAVVVLIIFLIVKGIIKSANKSKLKKEAKKAAILQEQWKAKQEAQKALQEAEANKQAEEVKESGDKENGQANE